MTINSTIIFSFRISFAGDFNLTLNMGYAYLSVGLLLGVLSAKCFLTVMALSGCVSDSFWAEIGCQVYLTCFPSTEGIKILTGECIHVFMSVLIGWLASVTCYTN